MVLLVNQVQPTGFTTTVVGVIELRWQPGVSADLTVGYFMDEPTYNAAIVAKNVMQAAAIVQYIQLDITQIVTTGNIPAQIFSQLTAVSGPFPSAAMNP
jgi:hypothetical protein